MQFSSYQKMQRELFEKTPAKRDKYVNLTTLDYASPFTFDKASRGSVVPSGAIVCSMRKARAEHADALLNALSCAKSPSKTSALVDSLEADGTFILVPKGVHLTQPIELRTIISDERHAEKTVVILEDDSSAHLIREAASSHPDSDGYEAHSALFIVGKGAKLTFAEVNDHALSATQLGHFEAHVGKDALIEWSCAHLGGAVSDFDRSIHLLGEGADASYVELFFGGDKQKLSSTMRLEHHVPRTHADMLSQGILQGKSRNVFFGLIKIYEKAQQTNSFLAQHAMLLSHDASCTSIPSLEIEANDVKASHAASAGQIDEEQLFYLRSRGISPAEAKRLIVMGFLKPALERIPEGETKERLAARIEAKWQM